MHSRTLECPKGLQMLSEVSSDIRIDLSNLSYCAINVHMAIKKPFFCLLDHCSLQMISEAKLDLRFEISHH